MEHADIISDLAPCGLSCTRCAEYVNGEISSASQKLLILLGNYQRVATIKQKAIPAFESYQQFVEILKIFAKPSCGGCRSNNNYCQAECAARTCHREKKVDFCFQCPEFPCDKPSPLGERWKKMNERMQELGVEQFHEEQSHLPRY